MPAPTALLRRPDELAEAQAIPLLQDGSQKLLFTCLWTNGFADDEDIFIDASNTASTMPAATKTKLTLSAPLEDVDIEMHLDPEGRPKFLPSEEVESYRSQARKVPIPPYVLFYSVLFPY